MAKPDKPRYPEHFGINELFKFRPYRTDEDKARVREILVDHKVWFSRASQLNDPEDLRPILQFRRYATEKATLDTLFEDAERAWARRVPPIPPAQLAGMRHRLATTPIHVLEREALERTHRRLEEYWILSLASERGLLRMWDEYADERRGVCIHFHARSGSPFRFAQSVIYQAKRPVLEVPFRDLSDSDVGDRSTRTKRLRWRHEREFRWIRYPDQNWSDVGLSFEGQHAHFPATAIAGVTVGIDMPLEDVESVREIAARHRPAIPLYRPRGMIIRPSERKPRATREPP